MHRSAISNIKVQEDILKTTGDKKKKQKKQNTVKEQIKFTEHECATIYVRRKWDRSF